MFPKFNHKFLLTFLLFLISFFLFVLRGRTSLDPDFGWHWRMGQIITSSGIPKTDPFSYTMTSFPFVDHEWLTNILIYRLNEIFGYNALVFLYSFLAVLSLVIVSNAFKKDDSIGIFKISLLVLSVGTLLPFSGVRPQVLSWALLALWLKVILDEGIFRKYFFLLPVLMILWANLHGSFAMGIFCLGVVFGLRTLRTKKLNWREILCFLLCFGATFINPYGWRLWGEVWQQISDSALRWRIAEWGPSLFVPIFPYLVLISLGSLIYIFHKRVVWEKLGLYLFFLMESLFGLRYIPLFVIVSLPIYLEVTTLLYEQVSVIKFGKPRWHKAGNFMLGLSLFVVGTQSFFTIRDSRSFLEGSYYPKQAVAYLKQNLPKENMFAPYNWGGYLIWQLPEKKVFIDGRMPSWRWRQNLPNESANAMDDYLTMQTSEEEFKKQLTKYTITLVLWPKEKKEEKLVKLIENLLKRTMPSKTSFNFMDYLKKSGWQQVYEDPLSIIYTKN